MTERGAIFSPCRRWRYKLWRIWSPNDRRLIVVGLNPSTADENIDDATIRRCIGYARRWEFGGIHMLNLFGYRATKPCDMRTAADPVGPGNKNAFDELRNWQTPFVLCAWGVNGGHKGQDQIVLGWLAAAGVHPQCLGITKKGFPRHPLYVPKDACPVWYSGRT